MHRLLFPALSALALTSWSGHIVASPAENLAQALTYKTVSQQDRSAIDYEQFEKLHVFFACYLPPRFFPAGS